MNNYFTKYLKVEGEIKENDKFYNPSTNEILIATKEMISWNWDGTSVPKTWKLVKLFLCSKNIKEGDEFCLPQSYYDYYKEQGIVIMDKVICTEINEENQVVHFSMDTKDAFGNGTMHSGVFMKDNPYKILGEISSEAKFVKELDEFTEEQIYLVDIATEDFPNDSYYRIKCPCCATFK